MRTASAKRSACQPPPKLRVYHSPADRVPATIPPAKPSISQWIANDREVEVQVWTFPEWERLPESERPGNAQIQPNIGWVELRPAD